MHFSNLNVTDASLHLEVNKVFFVLLTLQVFICWFEHIFSFFLSFITSLEGNYFCEREENVKKNESR